jgi:hypothetical protein
MVHGDCARRRCDTKRLLWLVAATLVALEAAATAGVVIDQQITMPNAQGAAKTVTHTTMIQGNRMKTISPQSTTIVDLDKGTVVTLDATTKTATEIPLKSFGSFMALGLTGEFKPTGAKKTIAGYSCDEYAHRFDSGSGEVSSTTCISKNAPGAAEASAFYHHMVEKISSKEASTSLPEGISLAGEATMKMKPVEIPNLPPDVAKKIAEAQAKQGPHTTKSVVTSVKAENLAADTLIVPSGYSVRQLDPSARGGKPGGVPPAAPQK